VNDYLIAIIIGIVEGLTEFLPVSSTAHIRLVMGLLGVDLENSYWKMFTVVIQLGAILAVVVYFWKRIVGFLRTYPRGASGDKKWWSHPVMLVILSFVVTAIPCYLIDKQIGENLESLHVMGWSLLIGGILMWVIDVVFSKRAHTDSIEKMSLVQAVVIGFAQIFAAAFPGTSRSMATIAGGQVMGLSRTAALEFSFFLSIPVMCAATAFKLLQFIVKEPVAMTGTQWGVLATGFVVSFFVAWACIAWFMAWVRKHGFVPFAIYRIVIGIIVLAVASGLIGNTLEPEKPNTEISATE